MADKTKIQLKRTSVAGRVPTNVQLDVGELAINLVDSRLFTKDGSNTVVDVFGQSLNTSANVTFRDGSFANISLNNITSGNVVITGNANVGGDLRAANIIGNTSFSSNVTINGILTVANTVALGNTTIPVANVTSNLIIGGGLTANGSVGTFYQVLASNGSSVYWTNAGTTFVSDTPPSNPISGNFWFDSSVGALRMYYTDTDSSVWIDVVPQSAMTQAYMRSLTTSTNTTITPPSDVVDMYAVTALASDATIAPPSGSPVNGQRLVIRLKAVTSTRNLTWTTTSGGYRAIGVTLPATLAASKTMYAVCHYNTDDTYWDVVDIKTQA